LAIIYLYGCLDLFIKYNTILFFVRIKRLKVLLRRRLIGIEIVTPIIS